MCERGKKNSRGAERARLECCVAGFGADADEGREGAPLHAEGDCLGGARRGLALFGVGAVADAVVIASHPNRVFDRAALRAIYRWKYKPRIVDGVATSQLKRQKIVFHIESTE